MERRVTLRVVRDDYDGSVVAQVLGAMTIGREGDPLQGEFTGADAGEALAKLGGALDAADAPKTT